VTKAKDPTDSEKYLADLAAKAPKRRRARQILLEPEEWKPGDLGEAPSPAEPSGDPDDKPKIYRVLKCQRIGADGLVRPVPVDLETDVHEPCPVIPLGVQGGVHWLLTPLGELRGLPDSQFGQKTLQGLFAPNIDWLNRAFAQIGDNKVWKGFRAEHAAAALMTACARKGVFDARDKVRGVGCWKGENGELVQHLGNVVLVGGKEHKPGEIGEHVYPGRPKVPPPIPTGGQDAAVQVFDLLRGWHWARGDLDARLLLGLLVCMILGGALEWRPSGFITGDAGTGKSTLQELLKLLLPGRMESTVDATPAALRQIINQDAKGVSFDEIEADMLSDQAQLVLKLARVAASGGSVFRGGSDHKSAEFILRGCFLFSAIVPPSMRGQDLQRLTFLRLFALPKGQKPPKFNKADLKEAGQKIAGRAASEWSRWEATLAAYEDGLQAEGVGHNQRGARQFGTLLAAADLVLHDGVPEASVVADIVKPLAREGLYEYENAVPAWLKTFRAILDAQPEVWRKAGFPKVSEILSVVFRSSNEGDVERARNKLLRAGLALVKGRSGGWWLAIPPDGAQIKAMFKDTDLRAHGGEGAWTGVLRGAPKWDKKECPDGIWRADNVPALQHVKCTLIRLDAEVELGGERRRIFTPLEDVSEAATD